MANRTATRREPARTATPEELAEESRRVQEARAGRPPLVEMRPEDPSTPVVPLALEAEELRRTQGEKADLVTISERSWAPSSPVEVLATLQMLAEQVCVHVSEIDDLAEFTGIEGKPGMTLAARLDVVERLIYGDPTRRGKGGLASKLKEINERNKSLEDRLEGIDVTLAFLGAVVGGLLGVTPKWDDEDEDPVALEARRSGFEKANALRQKIMSA